MNTADRFKLFPGMRLLQSALPDGDSGEWEFSTFATESYRLRITTIELVTVMEIVW
jgi:hypothetical protein